MRSSSRGESSRRAPAAEPDFVELEHYAVSKSVQHYVATRRKIQKKGADKAVAVCRCRLFEIRIFCGGVESGKGAKEIWGARQAEGLQPRSRRAPLSVSQPRSRRVPLVVSQSPSFFSRIPA